MAKNEIKEARTLAAKVALHTDTGIGIDGGFLSKEECRAISHHLLSFAGMKERCAELEASFGMTDDSAELVEGKRFAKEFIEHGEGKGL